MTKANECTCPSGDGSLRHPCPAHPTVEQAGGDERVIGWRERILAAHPNSDPGFWPDALLVEHMAAEIADLRAALAQPSPVSEPLIYACKSLAQITSSDGSGHADIALAILRMAGVCDDERERLVNEWKAARAWKPSPAQAEQAEAERPELWAVHAQGPDELYAAFTREDAEKHAAELNALPMPEGIAVGAVVVPSPWPEAEHWKYLAEQERDHKNEIAVRLRQFERICEGLPQDAIDGGWTVQGIRGYAKRLEDQLKSALARVAELTATSNRYGLDAHYFNKNLQRILRDFESFTPDELARSLIILAKVADEKVVAQAQHSVPEGWRIERSAERIVVMNLKNGAGYAAARDGESGIAESVLYLLAADLLAAAPGQEGV
ncbi:hypothetical protein AAA556_10390 [Pseudomonas aeruginosa]